jgi:transposase
VLHRQLLEIVRHDAVCRRPMTTPGVGPVVALTLYPPGSPARRRSAPPSA